MRNILMALFVVSCSACAGTWERPPVRPHTWEARASLTMMAASDAAIVCDLSQTLWMADGGKWDHGLTEMNPLLGRHPSTETIVTANLVALAGNTAAYFILPSKLRPYWFGSVLLVEGGNVMTQPSGHDPMTEGRHQGCDFQQDHFEGTPSSSVARSR